MVAALRTSALFAAAATPLFAFAHSGGLDSSGGHHDRKNGGYHYHRMSRPVQREKPTPRTSSPPRRTAPRTSTRVVPRTTARDTFSLGRQFARPQKEETERDLIPPKPKRRPPNEEKARKLLAYAESQLGSSRGDIGLKYLRRLVDEYAGTSSAEKAAARLLDLTSQTEFRTWNDRTGKFSVEARLIDYRDGITRLERRNGRVIDVALGALSIDDQRYVRYLYGKA